MGIAQFFLRIRSYFVDSYLRYYRRPPKWCLGVIKDTLLNESSRVSPLEADLPSGQSNLASTKAGLSNLSASPLQSDPKKGSDKEVPPAGRNQAHEKTSAENADSQNYGTKPVGIVAALNALLYYVDQSIFA